MAVHLLKHRTSSVELFAPFFLCVTVFLFKLVFVYLTTFFFYQQKLPFEVVTSPIVKTYSYCIVIKHLNVIIIYEFNYNKLKN